MAIIGYNTIGSSTDSGFADGYHVFNDEYSVSADGTTDVAQFYIYGSSAGSSATVLGAVYEDTGSDPGNEDKISTSDASISITATLGWHNDDITPPAFVNGTTYWIIFYSDSNLQVRYDSGSGGGFAQDTNQTVMPDPFPSSPSSLSREYSYYIDYTESGAAANPKGPLGLPLQGPFGGPIG